MARRTRNAIAVVAVALALAATAEVQVGDGARWLEESSTSGSGGVNVTVPPSPDTPRPTPTPTPTAGTPSPTTPTPSPPPAPVPSPTPGPTGTLAPTPTPTILPTPQPTARPTPQPTPTSSPTGRPSPRPIPSPTTPRPTPAPRPPGSPSTPDVGVDGSWVQVPLAGGSAADRPTGSILTPPPSERSIDSGSSSQELASDSDAESSNEASDSEAGPFASGSGDLAPSSSSSSSSSSTIVFPTTRPPVSPTSSGSRAEPETKPPTSTTTTRVPKSAFREAAIYICVTCAAVSVTLLTGFHIFSLDAMWLNWPHEWLSANGWELVLYLGYLQQLTSLSQIEIAQKPQFLSDFTDAFSWTNFLIQRSHIVSSTTRRLEVATLQGMDAFGDRIDISSSDLLVNAVAGVAVIFGILCLIFIALLGCGRKVPEDKFDIEGSIVSPATQAMSLPSRRRGTLWIVGFGVILWFVSLYPLTALATYELQAGNSNAALAVTVIVVFCGIILAGLGFKVVSKNDEQLMSMNSLKMYGPLYADVTHSFRWFFVVTALAQIALGICVGAIKDEGTQLTVALVIVIGYLAMVLLCSPFTSQTPLIFTAVVCVVKIVNYSVAFAFVSSNNLSTPGLNRAGDTILAITMVALLLWFVRLIVMLITFIRLYAERRHMVVETPAYEDARESIKVGMNLDTNPILGGSGVYVTMMMSPAQGLGSEFGDSFDDAPPRRTARLAQL